MKIIESIDEMREYSQQCKRDGKTISYVSSESYLHDGHMSLVKIAKENADITVLSAGHCLSYFYDINHPQRYKKYIIDYREFFLKQDIMICKENNVDVFFQPSMFDLYSNLTNKITLSSPIIGRFLEKRGWNPNLANGYGDIISLYAFQTIKIINILSPDVYVIGEKDEYETNCYKKTLIHDLNYPIKLIVAPTIRDSNGLALSSRNVNLTEEERINASSIYRTLQEVSAWDVYPPIQTIKTYIEERIKSFGGIVNWINICCAETLDELISIDRKAVILVNVEFGDVSELTDHIIIEQK